MNLYYARLSKFIKYVLYERLSKLRCKNIVIYKKMNFVSLIAYEVCTSFDFFYHSHRIADTQEFRSNSIRTIRDSYENKKRIDWTDSKRTDARSDGA